MVEVLPSAQIDITETVTASDAVQITDFLVAPSSETIGALSQQARLMAGDLASGDVAMTIRVVMLMRRTS